MGSIWSDIVVVGVVLLIIAVVTAGAIAIMNYARFPGVAVRVEQLRADVKKVDPERAEDVVGQAVEYNRAIVTMQRYNGIWWAAPFIPNGWDDLSVIDVGKE